MGNHHTRIEQHADADKEQTEQRVAVRLDVLLDLETVFGLRDQHAGEKGAEHEREAREPGEEGEQQNDEEHVQQEELGRAEARDRAEPGADHAGTGEHDQHEREHRLAERRRCRKAERAGRLREHRDHHEERHDGEILKKEHGHRLAALRRVELAALREKPRDDGRRRHGGDSAEREPRLPRHSKHERAAHDEDDGGCHLRAAQAEDHAPHRAQLAEAELEADREHEEHHAELGEVLRLFAIREEAERIRAERQPGDEIADERGQLERAADRDRHHCGREQHEHRGERSHWAILRPHDKGGTCK